jgi:hypothetical protein
VELIDRDTVRKNTYLPVKIAELSYKDPEAALEILRDWGEGRKPVLHLWDDVIGKLEASKELAHVG